MNRQQRRAARNAAPKKKPAWHGLTKQEKMEQLFKNGITAEDMEKEFDRGYNAGFADAAPMTLKTVYAAICLALHDRHGFGRKRCKDVLAAVDAHVANTLVSAEAIQEVYDRIGLRINFEEPFDRIEDAEE